MRTLRAGFIVFLLVFASGAPSAWASGNRPPPAQGKPASTQSAGLLSQAWSFLAHLWSASGCRIDPLGANEGCRIDPLGARSTSDTPSADHGCGLDPLGGDEGCGLDPLGAQSTPSADEGCGIDPLGRCLASH